MIGAEILIEMFKRVGLDYTMKEIEEFGKQKEWFKLKSWTMEEEDDFKAWAIKLLMKKKSVNKTYARKTMGFFLLDKGWTFKNEK